MLLESHQVTYEVMDCPVEPPVKGLGPGLGEQVPNSVIKIK